jgi:hypothetical protein
MGSSVAKRKSESGEGPPPKLEKPTLLPTTVSKHVMYVYEHVS